MFFPPPTLIRSILIFLGVLTFSFGLSAQDYEAYSKVDFVKEIKASTILVRLQDKALTIAQLKERGRVKEAEALEQKQYRENKEILLSFKNTFDFCPVYFFYASNSESIRDGHHEGFIFDNEKNPASLSTKGVFIAEFSETEELGIDGLILKDSQMLALPEHLPYFERRFILMGLIERSKAKMIEAYNHKLSEYLEM